MKLKSKSIHFVLICCSLTILSWLIISEAHPLDKKEVKDKATNLLSFSSNELPQEKIKLAEINPLTRNKRTVGFLRQLFPGLSQIIDRKIQQITRIIFRVVGRVILRGGGNTGRGDGGGSGDGAGKGDGGRKISITLPTYPPIDDEDEEETNAPSTDTAVSSSEATPDLDNRAGASEPQITNSSNSGTSGTAVAAASTEPPSSNASSSEIPVTVTNLPDSSNTIVRKSRDVSDLLYDTTVLADLDSNSSSSTTATESMTTKRVGLMWRLSKDMVGKRGSAFGDANGGGGSGNFLFDLVRLFAGSATTPEKDEELNAFRDERDGDGRNGGNGNGIADSGNSNSRPEEDTSGIPGPLTRFALLLNRGISNVIKDLILLCPSSDEKCERHRVAVLTTVADSVVSDDIRHPGTSPSVVRI